MYTFSDLMKERYYINSMIHEFFMRCDDLVKLNLHAIFVLIF